MARSEYDAEASWNNALLTTLYRAGKVHMLMVEVAEGRSAGYGNYDNVSYQRGFVLNSQTYLYFIKVRVGHSHGGCGVPGLCGLLEPSHRLRENSGQRFNMGFDREALIESRLVG